MLTLYKASAGSGKTFTLTRDYIFLLFRNENNFRHTLAVTFTNKASGEMKERIISQLYKLTQNSNSPYLQILMQEFNMSEAEVQRKAASILHTILHNYSFFFVETIDSFFQRVMQQFTRELGIQPSYNVELDNKKVLETVIEMLFLELEDHPELQAWLSVFAEDKIENEQNFNIKRDIEKLGGEIFKEDFITRASELSAIIGDKKNAKHFFDSIVAIKKDFENKLLDISKKALALIEKNGLTIDDFAYKRSGFVNTFYTYLRKDFKEPGVRFAAAYNNVDKWTSKGADKKTEVEQLYNAGLNQLVGEVLHIFESDIHIYNSAKAVYDFRYTLALLADISKRVLRYCEEENIFLLSNNNLLINEIIKENDTPFIYEKIGSQIRNYMIDEFQDTSKLQWANFKPLVENSMAEGGSSLIVGDVKQSIYRWRNGDWKLLGEQIPNDFKNNIDDKNLGVNFRSCKRIVEFNNSFFAIASQIVQNDFNAEIELHAPDLKGEYENRINIAYAELNQGVPNGIENKGYVAIKTVENGEIKWKDKVLSELPAVIEDLQYKGYEPGDIAFLVRKNSEATVLVDFFMQYKISDSAKKDISYDLFSTEALKLNNSQAVRFLIAILNLRINYDNDIAKAFITYYYKTIVKKQDCNHNSFERGSFDKFWSELHSKIQYASSIFSYIEQCILFLQLNNLQDEIPFLIAFQDIINEFEIKNSANLNLFLSYWDEKNDKLFLPLTENRNAMNVLTIHKSKGLEFKVVIIPFADIDSSSRNDDILWCTPQSEPFNFVNVLPVKNSSSLKKSIFYKEYFLEDFLKRVDILNMYYVAFTRAEEQLYIYIPKQSAKSEKGSLVAKTLQNASISLPEANTISLEEYLTEDGGLKLGVNELVAKEERITNIDVVNEYHVNLPKTSIMPLSRNTDFFDDFTQTGSRKSYGVLMHRLFEQINVKEDIEPTLIQFQLRGDISVTEFEEMNKKFNTMLNNEPYSDWFSGKYDVITERAILIPCEESKRPDRIMIKDDEAIVVDYKFTQEKTNTHKQQLSEYKRLLNQIGYSTTAFIWYVDAGEIVEV